MVDGSIEVPMAIMDDQFVSGETPDRRTTLEGRGRILHYPPC